MRVRKRRDARAGARRRRRHASAPRGADAKRSDDAGVGREAGRRCRGVGRRNDDDGALHDPRERLAGAKGRRTLEQVEVAGAHAELAGLLGVERVEHAHEARGRRRRHSDQGGLREEAKELKNRSRPRPVSPPSSSCERVRVSGLRCPGRRGRRRRLPRARTHHHQILFRCAGTLPLSPSFARPPAKMQASEATVRPLPFARRAAAPRRAARRPSRAPPSQPASSRPRPRRPRRATRPALAPAPRPRW